MLSVAEEGTTVQYELIAVIRCIPILLICEAVKQWMCVSDASVSGGHIGACDGARIGKSGC